MRFKIGQIVMFNWDNPFQRITRWRNKKRWGTEGWAHCGIITEITYNSVLIHEALSRGFVSSYYPKDFFARNIATEKIIILDVKKKLTNVLENANKYNGRGYAWFDVIGIVAYWIFGDKAFRFPTGAKRLICSEAIARILYDSSNKKINFEKEYGISYDLIEPMHIYFSKEVKHVNL